MLHAPSRPAQRHNLPAQLTSFVGRVAALDASAAHYRQLGGARGPCLALGLLGEVASSQGNHARAITAWAVEQGLAGAPAT